MSLKTGAIGPAKNHEKNCILYHSTMLNRGLWQFLIQWTLHSLSSFLRLFTKITNLEAQTLDEAHVEQEVQLDPVPVKDRLVGLMVQLRDRSTSRHLAVDAGVDLQKHSVASEAVTSKPRTWRSSRILEKSAVGFFTVVLSGWRRASRDCDATATCCLHF